MVDKVKVVLREKPSADDLQETVETLVVLVGRSMSTLELCRDYLNGTLLEEDLVRRSVNKTLEVLRDFEVHVDAVMFEAERPQ